MVTFTSKPVGVFSQDWQLHFIVFFTIFVSTLVPHLFQWIASISRSLEEDSWISFVKIYCSEDKKKNIAHKFS